MDDLQQVILDEVRGVRRELRENITDQNIKFEKVNSDISLLKEKVALQQQHSRFINSIIATIVSAITAWFVSVFGSRG